VLMNVASVRNTEHRVDWSAILPVIKITAMQIATRAVGIEKEV